MKCGADIESTATAHREWTQRWDFMGEGARFDDDAILTYIGPSGRLFLPRTIFVVPTITFFLRGSDCSTGCIPK